MNNKFEEFIKDTVSQKEISLVLAASDDEFIRLRDALAKKGYIFATNILLTISDLNNRENTCFVVKDTDAAKILYDFSIQYPTGQINLFDEKTMKNIILTPDFNDKSVILLITDSQIKHLQNINFDFLTVTGITYRDKEQ